MSLFDNAWQFKKTDPDVTLGLLAEGKALAQQLGEPWWVLFFDHWRLQALLHHKYDYRQVVDLAVQATLEARKPQYAELPQRVCLHEDLIYAYVGIDPEGHAERIAQALEYMQKHVGPDLDCRFCVQGCCSQFALQRQRLDEAQEAALKMLAMTDAERDRWVADHYALDAYADLCAVAFGRGDWDALREWAAAGEETARRREDKQLELAKFLAWRALLERRDGNEDAARRVFRAATARLARLKAVPGESYYDALCAYHEQGGDLGAALTVRDQELKAVAGKGRLAHEARCRLKRCRLLAQMGLPLDEDRAARETAAKLRHPEKYIEEIDRLAGGT
jgi:hypothetical protein